MKIKRLYINNYKSLVDFELLEPNPFSVFVGPNAAGKSNVFEALEFLSYWFQNENITFNIFGGPDNFFNKQYAYEDGRDKSFEILIDFYDSQLRRLLSLIKEGGNLLEYPDVAISGETNSSISYDGVIEQEKLNKKRIDEFRREFSRVFVGNSKVVKLNTNDSNKLRIDAANLEPVLHRILQDEIKRDEITEWMESLIPGLEKVEVAKSDLSGDYFLRIFEKNLPDPIGKSLISDGTYNILALLAAVYQSDEPQFLCIEEPENGLNPYVVRTLVDFFRNACEEKGHYIWLNTHSSTLVRALNPSEIILVDKIDGVTRAKQIRKDFNLHGLTTDEAWLSNAFGGGLPW